VLNPVLISKSARNVKMVGVTCESVLASGHEIGAGNCLRPKTVDVLPTATKSTKSEAIVFIIRGLHLVLADGKLAATRYEDKERVENTLEHVLETTREPPLDDRQSDIDINKCSEYSPPPTPPPTPPQPQPPRPVPPQPRPPTPPNDKAAEAYFQVGGHSKQGWIGGGRHPGRPGNSQSPNIPPFAPLLSQPPNPPCSPPHRHTATEQLGTDEAWENAICGVNKKTENVARDDPSKPSPKPKPTPKPAPPPRPNTPAPRPGPRL